MGSSNHCIENIFLIYSSRIWSCAAFMNTYKSEEEEEGVKCNSFPGSHAMPASRGTVDVLFIPPVNTRSKSGCFTVYASRLDAIASR